MDTYTFTVTGGAIRVTDPCYDRAVIPTIVATVPARNGLWRGAVEHSQGRVARLSAACVDARCTGPVERVHSDIAVDSGQCGFFDDARFPQGPLGEYDDDTSFYGKACAVTMSESQAGAVDDLGVVSSSGWGDGSYLLEGQREGDTFVALSLIFIGDEDDADEDDE